jgi:hypothetical protein
MSVRISGRKLGDFLRKDQDRIVAEIQAEAQAAGWHRLGNGQKAVLYKDTGSRSSL